MKHKTLAAALAFPLLAFGRAGERDATVARRFGDRDGSGVAHGLRRLGIETAHNTSLNQRLHELSQQIYSLQSCPAFPHPK